jgi:hypothetical protein
MTKERVDWKILFVLFLDDAPVDGERQKHERPYEQHALGARTRYTFSMRPSRLLAEI